MTVSSEPLLLSVFTTDTSLQDVTLSGDKTIQWVGNIILESAGEPGITQSDFLAQWHDVLPEDWRKHASMDLLKVWFPILYSIGLTME